MAVISRATQLNNKQVMDASTALIAEEEEAVAQPRQ